jgi:RNase P/RNase MRP subunit p30
VQQYALVSVESADSKTFQLACTTLPIDCVSLDLSNGAVEIDSASLQRAAARGVFIELQLGGTAFRSHLKVILAWLPVSFVAFLTSAFVVFHCVPVVLGVSV